MSASSIPKVAIEYIVGRFHVGTSDEEVATDLRKRVRRNPNVSATIENRVVNYALKCHHKNQDLYRAVVSGRL